MTAVLISLPYGWFAGRTLLREGLASRRTLIVALVVGFVVQVPLALLALAAGRGLGS